MGVVVPSPTILRWNPNLYWEAQLSNNKELADFLRQQCQERNLSLRRLSINAGLSPATLHGIVTRKYQPSLFSLNQVADYLGSGREYLWQLAGLLPEMEDDSKITFGDPRLRFSLAQVDRLPKPARDLIMGLVAAVIGYLSSGGQITEQGTTFTLSGNNQGLTCPFSLVLCRDGYCQKCDIYRDWQK